jgi:hypothetical protein
LKFKFSTGKVFQKNRGGNLPFYPDIPYNGRAWWPETAE